MAEITEARIKMADGTLALYVAEAADMPRLPEWPFLAIHVEDIDAARDLLDVLERSRARKRTGKEPEPEAAKERAPGPGPLPPKCESPECPNEGDSAHAFLDGAIARFCNQHVNVPESILREWHVAAVKAKEKEQGRRRAKSIREGVEGEPGKVA